jgi:type I restriction enzyme, R subunit
MPAHAYTEDQLVEQPALGLFAELGWTTVSALEEIFGRSRGDETPLSPAESQSLLTSSPTISLGRETKGEVVLAPRLRAALERLNPALPPEAIVQTEEAALADE